MSEPGPVPPGKPGSRLRQLLPKLLLALLATLFALAAGEVSLRLQPTPTMYMTMRRVVQQECTRPDAKLQYANKENYSGDFNNREFHTQIRINSHGLRDRETPYEKPPGKKRILVLGDSYAFGWGVEAGETAAKVLESRLRDVEVINAGCSGWGTRQELDFLQQEGIRYQPDLVLLFYCENDSLDNFAHYTFRHGRLMDAGAPVGWQADLQRWLARHSALWNLFSDLWPQPAPQPGPAGPAPPPPYWKTEVQCLFGMRELCRSHGARLAMVYVPQKRPDGEPAQGGTFSDIRTLSVNGGIGFVDLVPAFRAANSGQPMYFRLDDHWTRDGQRTAAETIERSINEEGWLEARSGRKP